MQPFAKVRHIAYELGYKLPVELPKECLEMRVLTNTQLRTTLGYFKVQNNVAWIELNYRLSKDMNVFRNTFLHELAHAWAWFSGYKQEKHGGIWAYYCQRLGIIPHIRHHNAEHCIQRNQRRVW